MTRLPTSFEMLEPLLADWAHATTDERIQTRGPRSFEEIKEFYDRMVPHAQRALDHLEEFDIDNLPEAELALMQLVLALAHATIAVEVQRAAHVPGVRYPHDIRVLQGLVPFG